MEVNKNMIEDSNPLAAFFQVVMDELRKRLNDEEFADLLEKCDSEREEQAT